MSMSRFDEREKYLDRLGAVRFISKPSCTTDGNSLDQLGSSKDAANFITKSDFDQIIGNMYETMIVISKNNEELIKENTEIKAELSYLKSIVLKRFFDDVNQKSHDNTNKLRELLQLPPINEKIDASIIKELEGILDDISDKGKSSVEILKEVRGA